MQHSTRRFGRVPRNRFSCVCDRAPAGMEYTLHSTGRNGYLTVVFSRALICAICTAGLRVAFLTNKVALTMVVSKSHQRKRRLATHQSYFDVDAVDQEFILHKHIQVETTHHVDHATSGYVLSSFHEPEVRSGSDC